MAARVVALGPWRSLTHWSEFTRKLGKARFGIAVLSLAVAALLLGAVLATLILGPYPGGVRLTGSATPPEYAGREVATVLGRGDFVTRAPDGEAQVTLEFNKPTELAYFSHRYTMKVWPPYRATAVALHTSDDGVTWRQVAERSDPSGSFAFDTTTVGAQKYWRLVVTQSGDAREVVIGSLRLGKSLASALPVDGLWLGVALSLLALLSALRLARVDLVCAVCVGTAALFVVTYPFGYTPVYPLLALDSDIYLSATLMGKFSSVRSSGYQTFLLVFGSLFGILGVVWVQLLLCVVAFCLSSWVLARTFDSYFLAAVFALAFAVQGVVTLYSPMILTEAVFIAGLTMLCAGLGAAARRPDRAALGIAGAGFAIAVLAKSVGIVLVAPTLLLLRFVPLQYYARVLLLAVLPGVVVYGLMSLHGYSRMGKFTPERFGGYALLGHVGWMLDGEIPGRPELSSDLRTAVAAVVAKRPPELSKVRSLDDLDRYVAYTTNEYNPLLWEVISPVFARYGFTTEATNDAMMQLASSTIARHPVAYAGHVAAHFYGQWQHLSGVPSLRQAANDIRIYARQSEPPDRINRFGPWLERPSDFELDSYIQVQAQVPLASSYVVDQILEMARARPTLVGLGITSLLLALLFLVPSGLAKRYAAEIMIALSINAYYMGQSLAQVALPRYSAVAVLPVVFLGCCVVLSTWRCLALPRLSIGRRAALAGAPS